MKEPVDWDRPDLQGFRGTTTFRTIQEPMPSDQSAQGEKVLAVINAAASPVDLAAALTVLAIVRHQANIRRLLQGEESKIGAKGKAGGPS